VLTSQGKAGEALALLQAAIAASPSYAEAHNNLGVLQRDVGAISDALASYERALSLAPDSQNAGERPWLTRKPHSMAGFHVLWRRN
jgi:Tfp pilus assembly protein PilF